MQNRKVALTVLLGLALMLSGCAGGGEVVTPVGGVSSAPGEERTLGDAVLTSNLKIKSTITDTSVDPSRTITIELYVDKDGDGQGLLGFGGILCDVKVAKDVLYLVLDSTHVVYLNDLTGRLVLSSTGLSKESDLLSQGFTMSDGVPIEYSAKQGSLLINTRYAQSTNEFDTVRVVSDNAMSLTEAIDYIIDFNTDTSVSAVESEEPKVIEDFYLNSHYGVTIEGNTYSVGDTCNTATYFGGLRPEGLLESREYKEDVRVDFLHASYVSTTGRTVFVVTSNYVQAIETNANFSFLGVTNGVTDKELKRMLGYKLSKQDLETYVPLDDLLEVVNYKSNTYYCTAGDLNIEFRMNKSVLTEIYIEQRLDFKR